MVSAAQLASLRQQHTDFVRHELIGGTNERPGRQRAERQQRNRRSRRTWHRRLGRYLD